MSSYRDSDQDPDRAGPPRSSEPRVRPQLAAAALFRSAASNQTLNIDRFRPRSPSPERDPHLVAFLAAQEAARGSGAVSSSSARGSRRERENLTAEENRARREREAAALGSSSSGNTLTPADQYAPGGSGGGTSSFTGLNVTKSRYQREKEEAERKAKDAEEAAAKAYEEFSAELAGPSSGSGRGRSGGDRYGSGRSSTSRPGAAPAPTFVSASSGEAPGERGPIPYIPSRATAISGSFEQEKRGSTSTASSDPIKKPAFKRPLDMFGDDEDDEPVNEPVKAEPPGKRMRAMEDFLGQLQRDQKAREERFKDRVGQGTSLSSILAFEGQRPGSRDLGDPLTTNICVLNLPANITEEIMGKFFCQWGDVGTVKVMWPRGDELGAGGAGAGITMVRRMQSAGLTGFVSFMRRDDAERAIRESDGTSWAGSMIRTSWGKTMPIPPRPQYFAPKRTRRERSPSPSASSRPRGEAADAALRKHRTSRPKTRSHSSQPYQDAQVRSPSPRSKCRIKVEQEYEVEATNVRTVAQRIQQHGPKFEQLVREKEKDNPKFAFLRDEKSVMYQYFNVLLNPHFEPNMPPDPFSDEGDAAIYSSDSGEDSEAETLRKQRRDEIGSTALQRFMAMLRSLTPRRERIARCMMFALDHAHACDQVVDVLCQSLLIPSTPIPRKLARLYVVSDILHNSANPMPNVWKYRLVLEKRLPEVFEHLGDVGRSFPSRIKAESWKQMVGTVLSAWEAWLVFPSGVLDGLGAALLAPAAAPDVPVEQAQYAHPAAFGDEDADGVAIDPNFL
ncbi:hypothetical protein CF319_g5881 [Tilletia indica]|nr:hypothetical protein CF319_g5881 [Tilletia indica]